MKISGYIGLRINSNCLDFDEINKNIKLESTQVYRKGDACNGKYGKDVYSEDGWFYEIELDDLENLDEALNEFVSRLDDFKDYIKTIYNDYYVRLWCDVYTDYAQFSITLTPDTIQKIAELGIGFDIEAYSHGMLIE